MSDVCIGLEIHIQLLTETKMWSRVKNQFSSTANEFIDEYTIATPGLLPVLNSKAHELGTLVALLMQTRINPLSYFDRKSYFYPDLPKSYQITQNERPLAVNGNYQGVQIRQVHLEEDTARTIHMKDQRIGLDLNRSGVPLVEIVTEPDFKNSSEVIHFLKNLHEDLVALKVSRGIMAHGNMRVDLNISLKGFSRVEIKNLNSFKSMGRAIELEVKRQKQLIKLGKTIQSQTYGYDEINDTLDLMRSKDSVQDYRYFRDPDIPALITTNEMIEKLRTALSFLPSNLEEQIKEQAQLDDKDVILLARDQELRDYFFDVKKFANVTDQNILNWLLSEYRGLLKNSSQNSMTAINPNEFAALLNFIGDGTISGKIGKQVLALMLEQGLSAESCIAKLGAKQISDKSIIHQFVSEVCHEFSSEVESYRSGKVKSFQFLMGQVMKKSQGAANPRMTQQILKQFLEDENE